MSHLIHRIRVELQASSRGAAAAAQDDVSRTIQDDLPAALESLLNARFPQNVERRLDHLELNLGRLPRRGFRDAFLRALLEEFRKLQAPRISRAAGPGEQMPAQFDADTFETSAHAERHEPSVISAFLHFVRTGKLPWWFPLSRWREEVPAVLIDRREMLTSLRSELPPFLSEVPIRILRLLRFPRLIDALASSEFPGFRFDQRFPQLKERIPELLLLKVRFAIWCLSVCDAPDHLTTEWHAVLLRLLGIENVGTHSPSRFAPISDALREWMEDRQAIPQSAKVARQLATALQTPGSLELEIVRHTPSARAESVPEAEEGLQTESAGVVLLHPFLPSFFRLLGWLNSRGKLLPERRWHAVHALYFIVHARVARDEAELVLEKTLCGITLHEPADWPEIDDQIRNETDTLLLAVIGHWRALRDTSPQGLREAFLCRPGLLYLTEQPRLHVEARSYDVLLDRLPWSIERVAFPWLRRPITIRWATRT